MPASIISDDKLQVIVTVSGCEGGSTLNVNDRETLLRTFPHSGGTMTLTLERNDIPYATAGLAANLSLNAVATCSDGRTNRSQPAPVSYFPVQRRIVEPQNAGQVVTDHFVIDGTSANPTFLGCGVPPTEISTLYRVNLSGKVTGTVGMPIACTPETVITERNPISGKRWVWTPNVGAFAVDAELRITARTTTDIGPTQLTVLPGGDAIIVNRIDEVRRLSHNPNGTSESVAEVKWHYAPTTLESVIAPPLVRADGMILIASLGTGPDASRTDVTVTELYAGETGEQGAGGTARAAYKLRTFARNERLPWAPSTTRATRSSWASSSARSSRRSSPAPRTRTSARALGSSGRAPRSRCRWHTSSITRVPRASSRWASSACGSSTRRGRFATGTTAPSTRMAR